MARSTARVAAARREQILEAAIARFGRHSYEDTSLRAIAADVGADVAQVHRSFGSKELLLAEAMRASAPSVEQLLAQPRERLPLVFADLLLARDTPSAHEDVDALDIFVRSLTSREASAVIRESITDDFIAVLTRTLGSHTERHAALTLAVLLGVGVLRDVLHVEPLLDDPDGELRRLMARVFEVTLPPMK